MDEYDGPDYKVVESIQGNHRIALERFKGTRADDDAAWVRIDGKVVLRIVAPPMNEPTQEFFQSEVMRLIKTHDFNGRKGAVFVWFNPPTGGDSDLTDPRWKLVEHRPRE